jgi:hypothetical protein
MAERFQVATVRRKITTILTILPRASPHCATGRAWMKTKYYLHGAPLTTGAKARDEGSASCPYFKNHDQ